VKGNHTASSHDPSSQHLLEYKKMPQEG
jgi:hypothetical protein